MSPFHFYQLLGTLVHSSFYPLPWLPIFSSCFSVFLSSCFLEGSRVGQLLVLLHPIFLKNIFINKYIYLISNAIKNVRDSYPWLLVWFIPIALWQSCYINTLVPDLTLSVILSPLSQSVRKLIWPNLTLRHMSTILSPLSRWLITSNFFLHCWLSLADFSLVLH